MGEEEEGAGETLLAMGWLEITLSTLKSYSGARLAPDGAQRCEMTIAGYRQICVLFLAFMDIGLRGWNWFDIGSAAPAVSYGLWTHRNSAVGRHPRCSPYSILQYSGPGPPIRIVSAAVLLGAGNDPFLHCPPRIRSKKRHGRRVLPTAQCPQSQGQVPAYCLGYGSQG